MDSFRASCKVGPEEFVEYTLTYVTRDEQVDEVLAWIDERKVAGLDLETSGLSAIFDRIATLQLGYPLGDNPHVYVVDVRCLSEQSVRRILDAIKGPRMRKLGMNIRFECKFLQFHYGVVLERVQDVQVAELLLRAGLFPSGSDSDNEGSEGGSRKAYGATSLASQCRRYLGTTIKKNKDLVTSFYSTPPGRHDREQLEYAAGDTIYPFFIAKPQSKEIEARRLKNILDIEFECIPILADTELRGMQMDTTAWRALWQVAEQRRADARDRLDRLFSDVMGQHEMFATGILQKQRPLYPKTAKGLDYSSTRQIRWAIVEYCVRKSWPVEVVTDLTRWKRLKAEYGQVWLEKRKQDNPTLTVSDIPDWVVPENKHFLLLNTKADTLRLGKLRKQLPVELVDGLLEHSAASKLASTYGIEFLNKNVDANGVFHAEFHQLLTSTGRISTVPNSQNIPHQQEYRRCFIPHKGYKFIIADYSQIEPRLSAQVSGDPVYTEVFRNKQDLYIRIAEEMFGHKVIRGTPGGEADRTRSKTIVLGLAYRLGPAKLRDRLTLALEAQIMSGEEPAPTFAWALDLWKRFFELCSGVKAFQDEAALLADPRESPRQRIWDRYLQAEVTWIEGPCGRKRFFPPEAEDTYTEAPNAPIQGSSATITKAAAVLIWRKAKEMGVEVHIVNWMHDELVVEVPAEHAESFAPVVKGCMEEAGRFWITSVPVIAEFPKGTNGVVDAWVK